MPSVPSIKGSVFSGVVEDVRKLLATGEVTHESASRWLEQDDLVLLATDVAVAHWYDVRTYQRMNELLRDVVGGGSNEYLRDRGRETARRLLEAGLYMQLEFLQRTEVSSAITHRQRFDAFGRDLRKLTTLSASILSFSQWTSAPDPDRPGRYRIEVSEAADFPETLCWRSDGFVNEMATQHGDPDLWTWERAGADRILFRMLRSL